MTYITSVKGRDKYEKGNKCVRFKKSEKTFDEEIKGALEKQYSPKIKLLKEPKVDIKKLVIFFIVVLVIILLVVYYSLS